MRPFHRKQTQTSISASEALVSPISLDTKLDELKNMNEKTKDELYSWTEREFPGTKQYTAAIIELERRKKRDNWIRVVVGITLVVLLLLLAWIRGW